MTRGWRWATGVAVSVLAVAGSWLGLVGAVPASYAASCGSITIAQGQGLSLDVSSVLVTTGGCVRFANLTDVTVTVKVSGSSFSDRIPGKTPASASASYVATHSATVTATDGLRSGRGTISVEAPPPTPNATQTFIPPPVESIAPTAPTHSPKPPPSPTVAASVTPTHTSTAAPSPSSSPSSATLPVLPSLPSGGSSAPPAASHPVVAPQLHGGGARQVSATVVEPVGGASRGLPAAVAIVVVIGLATAFGRAVLAASPAVDHRGRHARLPL